MLKNKKKNTGVGRIFLKFHNSVYYVPDSQKKKSLAFLDHRFGETPSKLRTNRPKICQILRSTSVFNVFHKSGGGGGDQKMYF